MMSPLSPRLVRGFVAFNQVIVDDMIHVEQCVLHELSDVPAGQGVEGLVTVATHVDEASGPQPREVLGHGGWIDEEM